MVLYIIWFLYYAVLVLSAPDFRLEYRCAEKSRSP